MSTWEGRKDKELGTSPQQTSEGTSEGSILRSESTQELPNALENVRGMREGGSGGQDWSQVDTQHKKRVFVCTNRWCKEKGSGATLGAFIGLAPDGEVLVQGVNCLGRCNKGPNLRVRQEEGTWLEFNKIDSVDRVYKILRDYLLVDVSKSAAECLQYNFQANAALDRNEVGEAIEYYDKAIATGYSDQEGVLLVMRATAFLQRAYSHRRILNTLLERISRDVPSAAADRTVSNCWKASGPAARYVLLDMYAQYCQSRGSLYQKTKFRYGLYEFALLRACEDALRATQLLPNYPKCWLRAGDALGELCKYKEASGYYQVALDLDESMASVLVPTIAKLKLAAKQEYHQELSNDPLGSLTAPL
ncbi:unnamed protein product [Choristocarpus tenellus]